MKPHKHAELIKAWADGAEVQVLHLGKWIDITSRTVWDEDYEYRIKPDIKQPVVRWQWAFEADVKIWEQYTRYMTEEEARARLASKFRYIKLEYTRTEFPE